MSSQRKARCGRNAVKTESESDMVDAKKGRSPKFTQHDTELLLKLINESVVNSLKTNQTTPHGRNIEWEKIALQFNAVANVVSLRIH